jgi:hypothetical protein
VIGDCVIGDCVIGDCVIGDCVIGDCVIAEYVIVAWRSQVSVDTMSAVSSLELVGTDTADMAMATDSIVERIDVIRHVGDG